MSDFNKQFGSNIRKYRESLGFTREKLCERASISVNFLSDLERGIKGCSSEVLFRISKALSVPADSFFSDRELTERRLIHDLIDGVEDENLGMLVRHVQLYIETVNSFAKRNDIY